MVWSFSVLVESGYIVKWNIVKVNQNGLLQWMVEYFKKKNYVIHRDLSVIMFNIYLSHPVFYGDLIYKLRRVKDTPNFISSGSKIVKRLRRRQYDPLIIETTIGLVLGPCTALCRLFLKHCILINKAVGTIWRALSKPPQRRQGPDLRPLWLLVGTPSAIRPELAFSRAEHSLPYSDVTIYIFCYIIFIIYALRVSIFMTSPLGVAVGLLSI